ncbi:response regulator transcription factor [Pseudochrobactrum sp. sp1633]|uniref:response regulator transcription factor n=1 Tax=Pseudochrobactrum sp. sp1633 TaxID=3036706 RepID=UPI0025A581BA|nr:response regulator transcription factor [Pseudochrobactrum sp. sp1633]MDM8346600.1 response regulator transcription factor [Pseudochrobactrum sp. sp1633]HWD12626.1 response regulator transcription factor [Pseudochrobactrum sp.]
MPISELATDLILPAPVLIVEDDVAVSQRLENLLLQLGYQADALMMASSIAEAQHYLTDQLVALALVDLGLPDGSGIDLIRMMHEQNPTVAILVISAWSTQEAILAALRAGATGYVLKERDDLEVALALRSVLRGGAPIDPLLARRIISEFSFEEEEGIADEPATEAEKLSPREHQILRLVAEGMGNRDIAEKLSISRYTVECHVKNIYRKLAVSSRTRAIRTARQRGLLA